MVKTPPFNVGGVGILGTKMPWGVAKIEKKKRNPFSASGVEAAW